MLQVQIRNLYNFQNLESDKTNKKRNKSMRKKYFKIGIMNL